MGGNQNFAIAALPFGFVEQNTQWHFAKVDYEQRY
jgi:hypothetical protein